MIVLGILTAVGIEPGLEATRHHRLAAQPTRQIEREMAEAFGSAVGRRAGRRTRARSLSHRFWINGRPACAPT